MRLGRGKISAVDELELRAIKALPGSVTLQCEGDRLALCPRGEVDAAVVQTFEGAHGRRPVPVDAIDAGAVTFMSAAGVALMLRFLTASETARRAAVLCRSSRSVDRLLGLVGLRSAFTRSA